jgi:hypothetical protein
VATGACLQAAAVATGRTVEDLSGAWGVGRGTVVDPQGGVDTGAIRDAYHQESTRLFGS